MKKRVALILSGSGVYDGSEIHEATLMLLYLDRANLEVACFAPDMNQAHVINHARGEPDPAGIRNILEESARIARGNIAPLASLNISDFDAIVLPGGFGAAKNLCRFAFDGADCTIDETVSAVINEAAKHKKVIGAICIAPVVVARALKDSGLKPRLTIGTDPGTMDALKILNAEPEPQPATGVTVDETNRIISSPAYMLASSISELAIGIEAFTGELLRLLKA